VTDIPTKNAPYIALSYKWGKSNNVTTTKSTLDDHKKGIMFHKLPKTIRDATMVARQLEVKYLWVDAICIVQDDASDWEQEAAKMGTIYMHSYCTIAAHAADNADDGFLEQALSEPKAARLGGLMITQGSNKKLHIEESGLSSRGWVLQERLLSQRTVHFASGGAIYTESGTGFHFIQDNFDKNYRYASKWPGIRDMLQQLIHVENKADE
jgi:hypothetical protein